MSYSSAYIVRPYEARDREALRKLFRALWPGRASMFDVNWWWRHPEPPIWVAEDKNSHDLVGLGACLPFSLYYCKAVHNGSWFVDFFVLPGHQRKGLGRALTRSVTDKFTVTAALQQSQDACEVFSRMGWSKRVFIKSYANPFIFIPGSRRLLVPKPDDSSDLECELKPVIDENTFDQRFDELWLRVRDSYGPIAVRDADALKAQYLNQPFHSYGMVCCSRKGRLAGYMLARLCPAGAISRLRWFKVGIIVDYLADPRDEAVFQTMLSLAAELLIKEGAQMLVCLSTVSALDRHLIKSGFLHTGTPLIGKFIKRLDGGFSYKTQVDGLIPEDHIWHLTLGDSDADLGWFTP
jgi:GNAT superfamily N-acetyltransferase